MSRSTIVISITSGRVHLGEVIAALHYQGIDFDMSIDAGNYIITLR